MARSHALSKLQCRESFFAAGSANVFVLGIFRDFRLVSELSQCGIIPALFFFGIMIVWRLAVLMDLHSLCVDGDVGWDRIYPAARVVILNSVLLLPHGG